MQPINVGDYVLVNCEADGKGKPGKVRYIKGSYYGVGLIGEGQRTDEWPTEMVQRITEEQMLAEALRFMPV